MDMDHLSGNSMLSSSDSSMKMLSVFQISTSTPLYFTTWTPTGTGAYAGTCIFLIVFAALFRGLIAGKHILEHRWLDIELNQRYINARGKPVDSERIRKRHGRAAWRFSVDLPRALYVTVMAGVGYLLSVTKVSMLRVAV